MKQKQYLLFLVLLLCPLLLSAQTVIADSLSQEAYSQILALHFSSVQKLLQAEKKQYPDNVYVDYLENYQQFLRSFISEDENVFDEANAGFDMRYRKISELNNNNPFKKLFLSNMNLQWAFARLKFGQYVKSAWQINKAYRLITANVERFPEFEPSYIGMGVLHIMIGLVPDEYGWMLRLISMNGSVEQGKAEIYRVLESSLKDPKYAYLKPEALFYLGFVELNLSSDQQSINKLMKYIDPEVPGNLLLGFLKADILIHHGENEKALGLLNHLSVNGDHFPFYYLDYLKGECYFRKLDARADNYFSLFVHQFHGINYIKDAWRKRAWLAFLNGDSIGYRQYLDSLLTRGATLVDADKDAQSEAKSGQFPNANLLRARLLFDGGYYNRSRQVLDTMSLKNLTQAEQVERLYRYGRIAHRLQLWKEAKQQYLKSLVQGSNLPRYFAANAALKLGQIYESEDSLSNAKNYYRQCLQLNFDEYRNSIRGKAKEGLERIGNKTKK